VELNERGDLIFERVRSGNESNACFNVANIEEEEQAEAGSL
jgi:hypothetical protein